MLSNTDIEQLIDFDTNHIWHPYTSAIEPLPCFHVESASGVYLHLSSGEKIIDGMSSWWSVIHGYNNSTINNAIKSQIDKMSHVMFGGLTHTPAVELARKLLKIAPAGLEHIFFSDSGSVAVEVAMKMAIQYWHSEGKSSKNKFITIRGGYHGDTWHAMSVCDPYTGMHNIFGDNLPEQYFVNRPQSKFADDFNAKDLEQVIDLLEKEHENIAAFILEPIVQGAGGMYFYHSEYLKAVRNICNKYNVLLIADEIATGFGRTGKLFACEHSNISPDIMCVGKAITGGYMSFASTLTTRKVAYTISKKEPKVFMHGPTFMGNPLACAAANASIDLLLENNWQEDINRIENHLKDNLAGLKDLETISDVRIIGAIGVVEMKENVDIKTIQLQFIEQGIWLRPFGRLIYTMPPYIINNEELMKLTNGIKNVLMK